VFLILRDYLKYVFLHYYSMTFYNTQTIKKRSPNFKCFFNIYNNKTKRSRKCKHYCTHSIPLPYHLNWISSYNYSICYIHYKFNYRTDYILNKFFCFLPHDIQKLIYFYYYLQYYKKINFDKFSCRKMLIF